MSTWRPAGALALALLFAGSGCDRDQVSRTAVAPAPPAQAQAPAMPAAPAQGQIPVMPPPGMPGAMPGGAVPQPPHPTGQGALQWVLPKGWTESPASGMRFATLNPPGPGKVELSVVVLPGPAGGELANVNRWRGQIGLAPLEETALGLARKAVKSKAGTVAVYDFTSEGDVKTRMVTGLLATEDGNTWFLKLMGDAEPVGRAKPAFMKMLETLRLG
jgi:hypothetical protein